MKKYYYYLVAVLIPILVGCSEDEVERKAEFPIAQFTFEIDNEVFTRVEDGQATEANFSISFARLGAENDTARIVTMSGLGDPHTVEFPPQNTLHVSFTNFSSDGFYTTEEMFQRWIRTGSYDYTTNGRLQPGVGIVWYDEQGEVWVSGKHVGEEQTGSNAIEVNAYQATSEFSILSYKEANADSNPRGFKWAREVEIQFACNLYNQNNDSIRVEDASFKTILYLDRPSGY